MPLYILGSSLFGAQLAAVLGLPYAFASHFAPHSLFDALQIYRENFKPSEQLAEPYAIAGRRRDRRRRQGRGRRASSRSPGGSASRASSRPRAAASSPRRKSTRSSTPPRARAVDEMLTYSAVGTGAEAAAYLADFQAKTGVDELITVHYADSVDNRVRSVEILAEAGPAAA